MNCNTCGNDTRVIESRGNGDARDRRGKGKAQIISQPIQRACDKAASWYTPDWLGRKRKCVACGETFITVELNVADVMAMMAEAKKS